MAANPSPLTFTQLVEPSGDVTQQPPPAPFNAQIAYLLGQCCTLTYTQYDNDSIATTDFSALIYQGYTVSAENLQPFTVSEANEPGPTTGDVGDYDLVTAGFGVQLTLAPTAGNGSSQTIAVIALRGTRTWTEWLSDNPDAFPTVFQNDAAPLDGLGSVHAGFYGLYTLGTDGAASSTPLSRNVSARASGSIASQVGQYVTGLAGNIPLYVTGHSLGGALAALCALDIGSNFAGKFSELYMYSLASPRVAVGISDSFGIAIPTLDNQGLLLANYQKYVPNSYRIVHAADIVPLLPPSSLTLGPFTLSCAHVTDEYQTSGSGATAQASLSGDSVNSITVTDKGSFYDFPPAVIISGGGGSGATAEALVGMFEDVYEINVTNGGSGYTSAPTVQILTNGGPLAQSIVNFCAQAGDIVNNHACIQTYVPYLAQLAAGFD